MWNMNGYLYKESRYSIRPKEYTTKTRSFAPPALSTINIKTAYFIYNITDRLCGYARKVPIKDTKDKLLPDPSSN